MHFGCLEGFSDRSVPTEGSCDVWHALVCLPGDNQNSTFKPSAEGPSRRPLTIATSVVFERKVVSSFLSAVLRSVIQSPSQPRGHVGKKSITEADILKTGPPFDLFSQLKVSSSRIVFHRLAPPRRQVPFRLCYLVVERQDERSSMCFLPPPTHPNLLLKLEIISLRVCEINVEKKWKCVCVYRPGNFKVL